MRRMNISVAKSYTDKNTNAVKTKWINIGSLVISDDGKVFGEIESIPVGITDFKINCFDRDDNNNQQPQQGYQQPQQPPLQYHGETYNAPHGQVPVHREQYNPNNKR